MLKSVRRERITEFSSFYSLLKMQRTVNLLIHTQYVVDPLFENISNIQLLHPDPVKEEDGEEDGMFMTANGLVSVEDHLVDLFDKADVGARKLVDK